MMDLSTGLSAAQVVIGIVGLVLTGATTTIVIRKFSKKQIQKTGANSFNIQAGGNVNTSHSDVKIGE